MSNPVREKFVEHMKFHCLTKETQRSYISGVRCLAKHYNQSPEKISDDQVLEYFRHLLLERKLEWSSCKTYLSGITYFYRHICNREVDDRFGLPPRPRGQKLPAVLSMEEVSRVLNSIDKPQNYPTVFTPHLRLDLGFESQGLAWVHSTGEPQPWE
jgi:site-specific recombinase XerD